MTAFLFKPALKLAVLLTVSGFGLAACTTTTGSHANLNTPKPVTPIDQYPLQAQTLRKTINLRINPNGLSQNQRVALDQIADKANWIDGEPVNVEIVTSGEPAAISAGRGVVSYLRGRDVAEPNLTILSAREQPTDIITVNMVFYRSRTYACNQSWENLTQTFNNGPYDNFGCAVNANLAAQIADPRDLDNPRAATPKDAARKTTIIGKYQKGEVTSAQADSASDAKISQAIN
ncbi:CpaD family pilus assembly protein [Asticcacaulis sp. 201]|uniref:CpaD family pilus assembly protein n=1 Tax=Asticcacaulis sp. 201 TaxID=3028787 RepID=UPI002916A23D|nr:CpaD family pilus assembly lipoprotein [Asticcacaulis sp. 201]MDV6332076.1 CpaD family pilus assembly lipoprotein [Asticcacaulis sp. 201]